MFRRPRTPREIVVAAVLFVSLVITLTPAGTGPRLPFSSELGVGDRWLADGILNLFFFVPLGLALGWNSRSPAKAVLCGLVLSTAVELAQIWIPGRDSSLSDIIFNTAGTALGALIGLRPRTWLVPSARSSVVLAALGVAGAAFVMTITALLLAPSGEVFVTSRSGNDLMLEYPTRADAAGLDQPVYWLPHAFHDGADRARVSVRRERARWHVSIGSGSRATLGPTVGEGWTLLAYPDAIARRWGATLSAVWLFGLCVPIGFWARRRLALVAAGAVALILVWIPDITGVVRTPFIEWIGAAIGLLAGAALGWSSRRIAARPTEPNSLSKLRR